MSTTAAPGAEPRNIAEFNGTVIRGIDEVIGRIDELDGRRVALVGEPVRVARLVACLAGPPSVLKVFQSDPVWVLPRVPAPSRPLADVVTGLVPRSWRRGVAARVAARGLERHVRDDWTRRQLTPNRPPTDDNIVYSNRYHRSLRRPDVELVTWPVAGVVDPGIRTADGVEHHVDVIVMV